MSEEKNQNEIEEVTNEDEHKDVEHYCYLCRRPESAAGNDWPAGRTAPTAELRSLATSITASSFPSASLTEW